MKLLRTVILFCFVITQSLIADEKTTVLQVKGFGSSHADAVQSALIQAVKQAKGVNIDSKKTHLKSIKEKALSSNETNSHSVEVDSLSNSEVKEATKGFIKEYRVVNSSQNDDREWEVDLEVTLLDYKTPGHNPHNRRKLAVTLQWAGKTTFPVNGSALSAAKVGGKVNNALNNYLVQTRRFTVLDRRYVDEVAAEKKIILSKEASADEMAKLGQVLGTDYLLVGTIEDTKFNTVTKHSKLTGRSRQQQEGYLTVHYRILVMATRQIKWSDTVTVKVSDFDFSKIGKDTTLQFDYLINSTAEKISSQMLNNIFPARVVGKSGSNEVILNQGGKSFKAGQKLTIYQMGELLKDPYTGESLGHSETAIAKVVIKRVEAKVSYATIEDGEIPADSLTKLLARISTDKASEKAQEQERPTVVLPF